MDGIVGKNIERMTDKNVVPKEVINSMSLEEIEDLALKHMKNDLHVIRHRGQVEIAREMRAIATSNLADILYEDEDGILKMRSLNELPREVTAAIKKIKIKRDRVKGPRKFDDDGNLVPNHVDLTGEVVEIELWDKTGAQDKLMRHYGGYSEDNKQRGEAAGEAIGANLDLLMSAIGGQGLPNMSTSVPDIGTQVIDVQDAIVIDSEGEDDI